jgi:predicted enzyme related to lactoylglutathione lyase
MDYKLQVAVVPVTDVDRAKQFYVEQFGFHLDIDVQPTPELRVVQLTPPGSACSVVIGPVVVPPGTDLSRSGSYQLVVTDLAAAQAELAGRGVAVPEIQTLAPGDGGRFLFLTDLDGNNWAIQEMRGNLDVRAETS